MKIRLDLLFSILNISLLSCNPFCKPLNEIQENELIPECHLSSAFINLIDNPKFTNKNGKMVKGYKFLPNIDEIKVNETLGLHMVYYE